MALAKMRSERRLRLGLKILVDLCHKDNMTVVEIGSYTGESAEVFLSTGKVGRIYCVDPWEPEYDKKNPLAKSDFEEVEKAFDDRFKDEPRVVKCKGEIKDLGHLDGVDLVYIDGNHNTAPCRRDILISLETLAPPVISGHDYNFDSVRKAVDGCFGYPDAVLCDTSWVKFMSNDFLSYGI